MGRESKHLKVIVISLGQTSHHIKLIRSYEILRAISDFEFFTQIMLQCLLDAATEMRK